MRARLERASDAGTPPAVLEPAAETEARELAEAIGTGADPDARCALGWLHWHRAEALPEAASEAELASAVAMLTTAFVHGAGVDRMPGPLLPTVAARAVPIADALLERLDDGMDARRITELVGLCRRIVQATPEGSPEKWARLSNLGAVLRQRFLISGTLADLDSAIVATDEAVGAVSPDHPMRGSVLCNIGVMLQTRYERSGVPSDLDRGIAVLEAAVAHAEAARYALAGCLTSLGNALRIRYDRDGGDADLNAAVAATERALTVEAGDPSALANLGMMLTVRYERHKAAADIEKGVALLRTAVEVTPEEFPNRCGRLSSLANALRQRHAHSGAPADLDEAIATARAAVAAATDGHPLNGMFLSNLAAFLQIRSATTGSAEDFDAAIEAGSAAVAALPEDSPPRAGALANLGRMFRDRFTARAAAGDLDSAISTLERAVAAAGGAPRRASFLHDLAIAHHMRAQHTTSPADRDAAIEAARAAVELGRTDTPDRAEHLVLLGVLLRDRFLAAGPAADLDEAIDCGRAAVAIAVPDARARANQLSNLAALLDTRFQRTKDRDDIEEALRAIREAVALDPPDDPQRPAYLSNLTHMHRSRFESTKQVPELDAAVATIASVLETTPRDSGQRTMYVRNLAAVLQTKYEATRSRADLDDAIARIEAAADLVPADVEVLPGGGMEAIADQVARLLRDEHAVQLRACLAWLHLNRAAGPLPQHQVRTAQLVAMSLYRVCFLAGDDSMSEGVRTWAARDTRPVVLRLLVRAQEGADPRVTAALPDLCRRILDALPDGDPARAGATDLLALAHWAEFNQSDTLGSLDAAIDTLRALVDATPPDDPDRLGRLSLLGSFVGARYERTGNVADLTPAVDATRAAARAATSPDERSAHLDALAAALNNRYTGAGSAADLDEAIEACRTALRLGSAADADDADTDADADADADAAQRSRVTMLVLLLGRRFELRWEPADIEEAVDLGQRAVEQFPEGAELAGCLGYLASAFETRFEATGRVADLNAAVDHRRKAVRMTARADERPGQLAALGGHLRLRFRRTGARADLNEAIEACRAALEGTPEDHGVYAGRLYELALVLRMRFEETGELSDVDEAVDRARTALRRTPQSHVDLPLRRSGLGTALLVRYRRTGVAEDLDTAIASFRTAVAATPPGHVNHARFTSNLALALWSRFEATGESADLTSAIESGERALAGTPEGEPDHAWQAVNLSEALKSRFDLTGDPADLDAAIDHVRVAVRDTPDDHPQRAKNLFALGGMLRRRAARADATADRDEAFSVCAEAAEFAYGAPSVRISAAAAAASMIGRTAPARAAELLEHAVRLLPDVAPDQLRRGEVQYALRGAAGLAADAAALALAAAPGTEQERAKRALRLLEAGRGVLLGRALNAREDHTGLRERHPELAERYARLRDLLDQPPGDRPSAPQERHRTADELAATLSEIRSQDGFASFGLPPAVDELLAEAAHGPVVAFNVSRYRSDALLLTDAGIRAVRLPELRHDTLREQVDAFYSALRVCADRAAEPAARRGAQAAIHAVLAWLWDSAAEPVLRALGHLTTPADQDAWPRVWWMPGGLLSLLPVHAAGHHMDPAGHHRAPTEHHTDLVGDAPRDTVMDRVVSSYTPTVQALRHARRRPSAPTGPARALIVAMPTTPGVPGELRNVPTEVDRIGAHLFHPVLLAEPAPGTQPSAPLPTKRNVLSRLPGCQIAHFACHGANDVVDPSRSRLLLHDHDSDPLTVASLAPVRLDQVELAYLSACSTAVTNTDGLADEAIHLAAAFQLVGYPHVIGTLWEVDDMIAVEVAEHFYRSLHADHGSLNVAEAAEALHRATRAVRDQYPALPSLWAAHLHAGA